MAHLATLLIFYLALLQGLADQESHEEETLLFGEFCLRIPDGSHWTTQSPDTKEEVTMEEPSIDEVWDYEWLDENETISNNDSEVDDIVPMIAVPFLVHPPVLGCRCDSIQNLPNDASLIINVNIRPAGPFCNQTEIIETLVSGREVCVSLSSYLLKLFSKQTNIPTTMEMHQDKATDYSWENYPKTTTPRDPMTTTVLPHDKALESPPLKQSELQYSVQISCQYCVIDGPIDLDSIENIELIPSTFCPVNLLVTLVDGTRLCVYHGHPWVAGALERILGLDIQSP